MIILKEVGNIYLLGIEVPLKRQSWDSIRLIRF